LWLSRAYRAAGRLKDARRTCETLLSSDPSNMAALRLAAAIALDAGNTAESYGYLDRALDAAAEAGLAFVDRAAIHWAAGDRVGTMADLDAAMAVLPRDSAAYKAAIDLRTSIGDR
jgi:tetratricopeptide (TPR) repeat protein